MNIRVRLKSYFKYRFMSGHIQIGKLTIYGRNAMHWGVTIHTKKYGYICFRLPFTDHGKWHPLYFYCSPNATPWAATYMIGHEKDDNWIRARIRYKVFGHNFEIDKWCDEYGMSNMDILTIINNYIDGNIHTYAMYRYNKIVNK